MNWLEQPIAVISEAAIQEATERQQQLTKPPGSLGKLEELAIKFSAIQKTQQPQVKNVHISIFAADHGIANENVSAFPQVVTTEMIKNFSRGGAAISVLAIELNAKLEVIDLGTVVEAGELEGVISSRIAPSTANFAQQAAMTEEQLIEALNTGKAAVQRAIESSADIFIGGDMGIANTTSATAMACVYLDKAPVDLAGPGTGLDKKGISHKAEVIQQALGLHEATSLNAVEVLRFFGGFEIAALTGAYIYAAQQGLPVMIDGFIATAAALAAVKIKPGCDVWFIYAHQSHEPGHCLMLEALKAEPLVNMNMRLGEASGAAVVIPLLRQACALHANMATFAEAGVSNSE
ncbi:MAG: nicotinate-nucleotide--dimethylbenzimidazole phosphoribosyltransferase [Gammaproteobacteria bacterium]|nr:nicotinate-nucleotide--dimethylbenzimidazole phosphoribosyltransferase [Gammaproteobacteria bacterium]MCW8988544.1 nicotinate-nucleotide--dimethylbenzimidazole phosphoribosyltransferase [Gammaproteobacteria bacterium]